MATQQAPTPPPGHAELQDGLHHLVQHNNSMPYRYDVDEGLYGHSGQPTSAYGSPTPHMLDPRAQQHHDQFLSSHYSGSPYSDMQGSPEIGLGIQFDGYGEPGPSYYDGNAGPLPYMHHGLHQEPPTPRSCANSDSGRQTRGGRATAATSSPKPRPRATKPKKTKAGKERPEVPKLTAPLSELTKDYANIPVRNMDEWVNRSAEARHKEVEKRNGYVTRPMNSFMLYRSAFAERTKMWCLQNNHQVVSSVSGESWPMEPPEVREQYNEYAKIERINHQNAHPSYKFSPSKTAGANRKRKGAYSDEEEEDHEPSDLDDDAEWGASNRRGKAKSRRQGKEAGYPSHTPLSGGPVGNGGIGSINRSSWEATNEGRPLPAALGSAELYHQYYQTTVHPSAPGIEDLRMRKMDMPSAYQHHMLLQHPPPPQQALLGLPGAPHHELMALHASTGTPVPVESQVDPMLLAFDSGHGVMEQQQFHFDPGVGMFGPEQVHHPAFLSVEQQHQHVPDYHPEPWAVDNSVGRLDTGSEFDKWMDDEHGPN